MNFFQNLSEMIARLLQGLFAQNSTPTSTVEESPQQPSVTDDTTTEAGQTHPQRPAIEPPPSSLDALLLHLPASSLCRGKLIQVKFPQ
jgi:hypothetical protein